MLKTILLAANDPNIIYLLQRYAEASGFQVVNSDHGSQLLKLAREIQPSVIVLEVEAPEGLWQESLQSLKGEQTTKHIPVVAHSCYEQLESSQVRDIAGILQKSVMYSDFVAMLDKIGVKAVDQTI